ncbi:MAG TPA: GntR family transcriptional regulator [Longimicrobiaceae bacterium]|nr:GntR family transcriptional regulator [Longimicrobiaceae bacterium]
MNQEETRRHLRYRIIGLVHVGRLKPGDPLQSIRQVAKETGADHRAVAAAYRALEAEGLVEIRPGAGVYLALGAGEGAVQSDTERWLSGLLLEAWNRKVSRDELATLVERTAAVPLRCACIESTDDHMVAVSEELKGDFSLDVVPVLVSTSASPDSIPREPLRRADLVVTTAFHATAVRAAALRAGKPCVVLSLNPEFSSAVARTLERGDVTAVISDPRFGVRAKAYLDVSVHRGSFRFVLVDELDGPPGEGLDLESDRVLVTRAARRRLGLPDYHLVLEAPGYISPDSARELCELIVRLGLRTENEDAQ